jgi:hypothetical protein
MVLNVIHILLSQREGFGGTNLCLDIRGYRRLIVLIGMDIAFEI